jgi:O-antigen ligase
LAAFGAVLALATQFTQAANLVAIIAGLIAFAAGWLLRGWAIRALAGAFGAWLLAAPLLLANPSWAAAAPFPIAVRAEIWAHAARLISERPILGHGLDAARVHNVVVAFRGESVDLLPLHPHSASLHIWLETGTVGALLAAAALIWGGVAAARRFAGDRNAAAAICGALASFGVLANSTYGAWQEWWIAAAALVGAMICALPRSPAND